VLLSFLVGWGLKNRRVASRQTPSFLSANKKEAKSGFSCGGHLFRGLLYDLLILEVLIAAVLLCTEGGARIYCSGPKTGEFCASFTINPHQHASPRGPNP
jgi:hypothetical protein